MDDSCSAAFFPHSIIKSQHIFYFLLNVNNLNKQRTTSSRIIQDKIRDDLSLDDSLLCCFVSLKQVKGDVIRAVASPETACF